MAYLPMRGAHARRTIYLDHINHHGGGLHRTHRGYFTVNRKKTQEGINPSKLDDVAEHFWVTGTTSKYIGSDSCSIQKEGAIENHNPPEPRVNKWIEIAEQRGHDFF